jgi:hypothetical protein
MAEIQLQIRASGCRIILIKEPIINDATRKQKKYDEFEYKARAVAGRCHVCGLGCGNSFWLRKNMES